MKRKVVIPFGLLLLMLVAVIASIGRAMIYVMNPTAKSDQVWGGCLFAGVFVGLILAKAIASAWPETQDNSPNTDRNVCWGGISIEISADAGGDGGGGDGGGGDGGGGE